MTIMLAHASPSFLSPPLSGVKDFYYFCNPIHRRQDSSTKGRPATGKHSSIQNIMKRIIHIISLAFILSLTHFSANAVTDKEMEQARTIATKAYLRYANDGSGYLDDIKATTMAELEKSLKPKEKENLKAFKAIPVPKDYKTWDKQKLVDYWGVKAFATPGLVEKGRIGRTRAKKNINAMTVTPPAKETAKETPAATSAATAEPEGATKPSPDGPETMPESAPTPVDSIATDPLTQAEAAIDALSSPEDEPIEKKADNHTWIYVVILCILVAVVVALVVFASNVMKKSEAAPRQEPLRLTPEDASNNNALREKFAATLNSKNEEIKALSKKIESLNSQNAALKANLEGLTAEIASLRNRLNSRAPQQQSREPELAPQSDDTSAKPATQATPKPEATSLRTIYLGRANARGIFVRADRNLNIGNSIFRLDTSDGYAGSFRVANNPSVWENALLNPNESLAGACVIANPDETDGMSRIVNDSAGTAILEGGCWKVIRKAKVHLE